MYFAVLVKYEDLDGDVVQVDLMESKSAYGGAIEVWTPMRESWGSASAATPARPFVTNNVIPANWSRIAPSLPPSPLPRRPRSLRARPLPRLSRLDSGSVDASVTVVDFHAALGSLCSAFGELSS